MPQFFSSVVQTSTFNDVLIKFSRDGKKAKKSLYDGQFSKSREACKKFLRHGEMEKYLWLFFTSIIIIILHLFCRITQKKERLMMLVRVVFSVLLLSSSESSSLLCLFLFSSSTSFFFFGINIHKFGVWSYEDERRRLVALLCCLHNIEETLRCWEMSLLTQLFHCFTSC